MLQARRLTLGLALTVIVTTTTFGLSTGAGATPQGDLANATAQAKRLEAEIQANGNKADALDEQYLEAQSAVADANKKITAAERSIASTEAHSAQLHAHLGDRAALLYMGAGNNDPLGIDATSVQDLGSRTKYTEAAAAQDSAMLDELKVVDEQLHGQRSDLLKVRDDAQQKQKAADGARKSVAAINAKMQHLLASTNANIRSLAARIEQQRLAAQAAAERARLAQIEAQQTAARTAATGGGGGGAVASSPADIGVDPGSIPAPSGGAAGGDRLRPGADRQALRLRRHRSGRLRLLRAHDDGLGAGRSVHGARLTVAVPVVPARADLGPPAGRPRVLREFRPVEPSCRYLRRRRDDDRSAAHRCVRALRTRSTGPISCRWARARRSCGRRTRLRNHQHPEFGLDLLARLGTERRALEAAVAEQADHRDALHAVLLGELRLLVDVDLHDLVGAAAASPRSSRRSATPGGTARTTAPRSRRSPGRSLLQHLRLPTARS